MSDDPRTHSFTDIFWAATSKMIALSFLHVPAGQASGFPQQVAIISRTALERNLFSTGCAISAAVRVAGIGCLMGVAFKTPSKRPASLDTEPIAHDQRSESSDLLRIAVFRAAIACDRSNQSMYGACLQSIIIGNWLFTV